MKYKLVILAIAVIAFCGCGAGPTPVRPGAACELAPGKTVVIRGRPVLPRYPERLQFSREDKVVGFAYQLFLSDLAENNDEEVAVTIWSSPHPQPNRITALENGRRYLLYDADGYEVTPGTPIVVTGSVVAGKGDGCAVSVERIERAEP